MSDAAPADTDPGVFLLQIGRWRSMSPIERARLADRLSSDVRRLAAAGIRAQRPSASDEAIRRELVARCYGTDLADAAYGPAEPA